MTQDFKELVQTGYDIIAQNYHDSRSAESQDVALIHDLIERLPPNARVLDAGCGSGVPITRTLNQHANVIGVDFSETQLALARQHVPDAEFQLADMTALAFEDETFHAVVSYYAIIHVPRDEQSALLRNFQRMLKPGGYLLISMGSQDNPGDSEDNWLEAGAPMYWSHFDAEANLNMVQEAGFGLVWSKLVAEELDPGETPGYHLFIMAQKPPHLTHRPATIEDAPIAAGLYNAWGQHHLDGPTHTVDEARTVFETPGLNLKDDTRFIFTHNGQAIGYATLWNHIPPYTLLRLFWRVHPHHTYHIVGKQLLVWAEERASIAMQKAPPDSIVRMHAQILSTEDDAREVLEQHNFMLVRHFLNMQITLDHAPDLYTLPNGITIRTFVPGQDDEATVRANYEAFEDHWGHHTLPFEEGLAEFRRRYQNKPDWDPTLWFLAVDGDEVVGICLCAPHRNIDPDTGHIHVLGVRKAWRGRGLGKALLLHAFHEFHRRGKARVGLYVDASNVSGATRLYEGVGMNAHRQWDTYEKILRSGAEDT